MHGVRQKKLQARFSMDFVFFTAFNCGRSRFFAEHELPLAHNTYESIEKKAGMHQVLIT